MAIRLSAQIREAREARGWSRARLDEAAGLPARTTERIELKGQTPRGDVLMRLAAALDLDPVALSDGRPAGVSLEDTLAGLVDAYGPQRVLSEAVRIAFRR